MRIHCLTTGVVRPKRGQRGARRYLPGAWAAETLPVNVFAIEHPHGVCVFDTGQEAAAAEHGYFPWWHPYFRLSRFELAEEDELAPQLEALGLLGSVRWVVLSHLHTDHVGGLGSLSAADVVVSRREWEGAQGLAGRWRGHLPQHWPQGLVPRLVDFDGPRIGPFPASHDLGGDGRLVLVPTPGHTAGHLSMLVIDGDTTWLCGGDLAHDSSELESIAPEIASFARARGVVFLAAHDPLAAELIRDQG